MSIKTFDDEYQECTTKTCNRVLAVLMAEHPRLGASSIIPQDVAVMIAEIVYWQEKIVSYMNNMNKIKNQINFLVSYPHSVSSVNEWKQLSMTDEMKEIAEAYALNLYKSTYSGREPQRWNNEFYQYSEDDFWILQSGIDFSRRLHYTI
jgi:hypothetical protein